MFFSINPQVSFDASLSSDKVDSFDMLEELIEKKQELEDELAERFTQELINNASQVLHSTKDQYINAITIENGQVSLDTSQFVVGMVEEGVESFDMKPGHLQGKNVKINKQGKKYAVVPVGKFKHGRYNWRDRSTGRFDKGQNVGGDVEFRVISENSDPTSWIHPGYEGNNFMIKTLDTFDSIIDEYLDAKIEASLNKL